MIRNISNFFELTKPRVTLLVVFSALVGFELGRHGHSSVTLFFHAMVGTWLLASGASALNMWMESDADAKMLRTCRRPIPSSRVSRQWAFVFGLAISALAMVEILLRVNWVCAAVGLATWVSYLFIYTPLKRHSSLSTVIGAIPGALPPVMGWAAAKGSLDTGAWILFGILFLWQVPHFLAIACMYRDDYERGGFKVMPVLEGGQDSTGRQMILYAIALIPVSLLPSFLGITGATYFFGATLLGLIFAAFSFAAAYQAGVAQARRVLLASVTYLPFLQALMLLDKVR